MSLLVLDRVEVGYHGRAILPAVDLDIKRGTFLGIVGPNGSGKTTLVRTMLGLVQPVSGRITYPAGIPRFGYVPQRPELERSFPLTAMDMVLMGTFSSVKPGLPIGRTQRETARSALERVGLGALTQRP